MTKEEFKIYWDENYSNAPLISYDFKYEFNDRWFRIHSLPESKRYAENEYEWNILLSRQNELITDLIGENSQIILITGGFQMEGFVETHDISDVESIKGFKFIQLDELDLHKIWPDMYEAGHVFKPLLSEQIWRPGIFNNLLKDLADDQLKAFFVSKKNKCLIAPYDGGVDVILKDERTKEIYKEKYSKWLSKREDGL